MGIDGFTSLGISLNLAEPAIHVVPDEVIWTVNWLHYLNYEPIALTSSTCHLFCTKNDLG